MEDIDFVAVAEKAQAKDIDFVAVAEDASNIDFEGLGDIKREAPEFTGGNFLVDYYNWLHSPTEPAKGNSLVQKTYDYLTRIIPKSVAGTTVGLAEFPYLTIKSFTDPILDLAKHGSPIKTAEEIGKSAWQLIDGIARFMGEPIGVYGWEKLKDKWATDPAAGIVGVLPTAKGVGGLRGTKSIPTEFGAKAKGFKEVARKVYDWIDVEAPFQRAGAKRTGIAVKTYHAKRIVEQERALQAAKRDLRPFDLTPEEGMQVTFRAGDSPKLKEYDVQPKINQAAEVTKKYYTDAFDRLKKDNVLSNPWPESHIMRNEKKIFELQEQTLKYQEGILKEEARVKTKTKQKVRTVEENTETIRKVIDESAPVETVAPETRSGQIWETRVRDALDVRGFSGGEIDTALSHIRGFGGAENIRTIEKIIREKTTEKIKQTKIIDQITEIIRPDKRKINTLKRQAEKNKNQIVELETINEQLKEMDPTYVHIPLDVWFRKIREVAGKELGQQLINQSFTSKFFKGRFFRQRKTLDIGEMIEWLHEMKDPATGKKIFEPADFDARMIMAAYAQKMGEMRGLADIFNNAKKDGLVRGGTGDTPNGYGLPPFELSIKFPELRNTYIHNAFSDYMMDFIRKGGGTAELGRIMGYTKMMAFYNPLILPAYDMWQASWIGSARSIKTPLHLVNGIKSVFKKDKAYWEAAESGAFSTPFTPPFENFVRDMRKTTEGKLAEKAITKLDEYKKTYGLQLVDDFYRANWNCAWAGDHAIRMMTYHYLKDKYAMAPLEAGQMTAYFHGDYAKINPKARSILNKILFTPSFKYAMGHLQANMIGSSVNVMRDALKLQKPKQRDLMFTKGGLALIGGSLAKDWMMKQWGFRSDDAGLRYVKETETDEGLKELVIYWPDPNNVILRQVHKWTKWSDEPEKSDEFLNKLHWDLHPLWSLSYELISNKKSNVREDSHVYNPFDDGHVIAWDIFHHSLSKIVAAEGFVEKLVATKGSEAAYKALSQEVGWIQDKFLTAVTLAYLRNPIERRKAYEIRKVKSVFDLFRKEKQTDDPKRQQDRIDNLFNSLEKINDEIESWRTQ